MHQQTPSVALEGSQDVQPRSLTGFVFTTPQKMTLIVLVMGLLYLRLYLRRRKKAKVCAHCGHRNASHATNCFNCSAPLFKV